MPENRFKALVPKRPPQADNALKYDPDVHPQMIRDLGQQGKFPEMWCASIGVTMSTLYNWADRYSEFEQAFHIAWYLCRAYWAEQAQLAATKGSGVVSPTIMALILTRRFPDTYGRNPRSTHEHFVNRNNPEVETPDEVPKGVADKTNEELEEHIAELMARATARNEVDQ